MSDMTVADRAAMGMYPAPAASPDDDRARPHCCFALVCIRFTPGSLRGSVPLFLKRQRARAQSKPHGWAANYYGAQARHAAAVPTVGAAPAAAAAATGAAEEAGAEWLRSGKYVVVPTTKRKKRNTKRR